MAETSVRGGARVAGGSASPVGWLLWVLVGIAAGLLAGFLLGLARPRRRPQLADHPS